MWLFRRHVYVFTCEWKSNSWSKSNKTFWCFQTLKEGEFELFHFLYTKKCALTHRHTHTHTLLLAGRTMSLITSIWVRVLRTASYAWNVRSPQGESQTHTWIHTSDTKTHTWKTTLTHALLQPHTHSFSCVLVCNRISLHMRHSCAIVLFPWGTKGISSPSVLSGLLDTHSDPQTHTHTHIPAYVCACTCSIQWVKCDRRPCLCECVKISDTWSSHCR